MKNILALLAILNLTACAITDGSTDTKSEAGAKVVAVKVDPDLDRETSNSGGVVRVNAPYRETVHVNGRFRKNLSKGIYSFQMENGFLKDQVEELLINHPRIKNVDSVVWKASPNFQWPSTFVAQGETFEHVLDQILSGYQLEAVFMKNDVVVIQPLK